jgi:hypothetical protein
MWRMGRTHLGVEPVLNLQGGCRFDGFSAYYPGPAVSPLRHLWQSPKSWTTTWRTWASVLSLSLRASVPYWTVPEYVDRFCSVGSASTRDAANKLEYGEAPGSQAQASFDDFHFFHFSIPKPLSNFCLLEKVPLQPMLSVKTRLPTLNDFSSGVIHSIVLSFIQASLLPSVLSSQWVFLRKG